MERRGYKKTHDPTIVSQAARPPSGGEERRGGGSTVGSGFSARLWRLGAERVVAVWRELSGSLGADMGETEGRAGWKIRSTCEGREEKRKEG